MQMPVENRLTEYPPIRLAVNAIPLLSPLTGIGHYVKALMHALQSTGQVEANYFYAGGWSTALRNGPLPETANQVKLVMRRLLPQAYEMSRWLQQRRFGSGMKSWPADIHHEPNFLAFEFDGPTVLTVHDLSWIRHPETHPVERVRAMNKLFEPSLRRSHHIITDAHFVKQELIDVFGIDEAKIHPIHLAADDVFEPMREFQTRQALMPRGLLHGEYWLSVGTLEPRKNLKLLFEAFSQLLPAQRKRCPLVVMGMAGWGEQSWLPQMRQMVNAGEVIFTGYVPRQEQAAILAGAKALVYPSLYEGFGLPLVEAMQCGVPVIAANASCLPEVLGGAGVLIDPLDPTDLKERMKELLDDAAFAAGLANKGLTRSQDFSWAKCAQQTLDVYKLALG
jgi:glycosyltransferase involved in cell wall biosynthesis